MPRLQLVENTGTRIERSPPALRAPRLYLVADTGSRIAAEPARRPLRREGGWLSLAVAMAAASASLLVATAGYERAGAAADWTPAPAATSQQHQRQPVVTPGAPVPDVFGND